MLLLTVEALEARLLVDWWWALRCSWLLFTFSTLWFGLDVLDVFGEVICARERERER